MLEFCEEMRKFRVKTMRKFRIKCENCAKNITDLLKTNFSKKGAKICQKRLNFDKTHIQRGLYQRAKFWIDTKYKNRSKND